MDVENDKPLPDQSPDYASDNTKTENNNNDDENYIVDQDLPQNDQLNKIPSSPKPSIDVVEPDPENADAIDSEVKDDQDEPTETKLQESSFLPPDLNKVSEEIDQYISTLLSTSKDNESTAASEVPIFIEQFAVLVEAKLEDYDSIENHVKWSQLKEEDSVSFLETMNRVSSLSKVLTRFSSEYKYSYTINSVGGVLQRAMSYLEEEFKSLLEDHKIHDRDHPSNSSIDRKHKRSASSSSNQELDENVPPESATAAEENNFQGYSEEILSNLIKLSKAMMDGGYETECCQLYFVARRNALDDSLHKLGFEKYSIDDVQKMQWESLEREIVTWIKAFKNFAEVQLTGERKLTDIMFSDYPSISQSLISSLSHGVAIQLLNFAEAVALTKRAAEKLFKFLDIYEALRDNLFPEEWVNDVIKTEVSMIKSRLGEAIVSIFMELENSIKADSGKTQVPGGAVHPLTRYTMNYLKYACEYKETLEQVFREHQKIERADSGTGSEFNYNPHAHQNDMVKQSPFQSQMIKVMDLLDSNLENKSKLYKDASLKLIFMMNNGRYILQKFKGSNEINSLMGDSWYRRKSSDLRQYHKGYQRETWGKLLSSLHTEGLMANGKIVKPAVKERFKSFNAMFDEIHKTQSSWVVSDEQLQSELRVSISNMVIPAYRSFLGRFSPVFTPGRQTEKYVKYQPEEIETLIDELFDGSAATMARWKL
ncbi:hypothetical protein BUALT_Bualt16G0001000 [Buddleja alternifolia]|uniref:Exocyst subunit Exo70 family protein n=1 Tax=Buddleja alternifolia TaxID=168488 RepID=A0AAV6WIK8_9LAMI|nr:hypothetical protein BUALT_Bualt16G0001000 [Buddleja alternifolia]